VTTRRRLALLAALLVILGIPVGGVAWSFWTAGGSGAGSGANGTLTAISLSPGTPTATLFPGGSTNVVLTATNTNTAAVRIGSLALDPSQGTGGFAVDAGHSGCSVAALSYTTQTNGGSGWTVPKKVGAVNGTLAITLTNALSMSGTAANGCQGATFTVYLVAGP
jgi:hypothetical protein